MDEIDTCIIMFRQAFLLTVSASILNVVFVPFCSQTFAFIIMFATDLPIKVLCLTYFTWKFARRVRKGVKRRALFSVVVRTSNISFTYTVLQKYTHIGLKQNLLRSTTIDIITRLLTTLPLFVFTWWEDFLKISRKWLR